MRSQKILPYLGILPLVTVASAGDPPRLEVSAAAADVGVPSAPPGRGEFVPDVVDVALRIAAGCQEGRVAEALTVAVADTSERLRLEATRGSVTIDTTLRVPGRQLAPIIVKGFCTTEDSAVSKTVLQLPQALTMQVSLRCSGETGRSIHYATEALDLRLRCASTAGTTPGVGNLTGLPW